MCGIFGIVVKEKQQLGPILIEAAKRLTYRGYDSVGAATIDGGIIDLRKDIGRVEKVAQQYNIAEMSGQRGITQLRWATFGEPSKINAQPHIDSDGDMVGAHNGNVVNNVELQKKFKDEGLVVRSQNDGESCVHAVELYINQGKDFIEAIRLAYGDLQGDYAFVIGRINDDRLFAIKKGSGLVAGIGDGFTCVSSDLPSLLPLTRRIIRLEDGEIVTLYADRYELHSAKDGKPIHRVPEIINEEMSSVQKGGFDHFMLKEIHEQPVVASELLRYLDNNQDTKLLVEKIRAAEHVYFIGCGTSYHACMAGSVYFSQLAKIPVVPVLAPQFAPQYLPAISRDDVGIFVSQSGETKDVLDALVKAKEKGMTCFGVANVIGSSLTRLCASWLPLCCGYEISVPATKTFTNQVITFLYLASLLGGHDLTALRELPVLMESTIRQTSDQAASLVKALNQWGESYCLGFGATYPIALEGALKLKEVSYSHCEGMLSTEFKHGPLSAVVKNFPVIFVCGPLDTALIVSGINEVTCRGGNVMVIAEENETLRKNAQTIIPLPMAKPMLSSLLAVIPLQLLAYYSSVEKGFDPDFPRNLSKTLTVD